MFKKSQYTVNEIYLQCVRKVTKTGGYGFHREIQSFSTGDVGKVDFFRRKFIPVRSDVVLDNFVRL